MKIPFSTGILRLLFPVLLGMASVLTTACKKDEPKVQDYTAIDEDLITKYLADNKITTAQKQAAGFYFLPVRTNTSAPPVAVGSTVAVVYTGHLLDAAGTVFDATSRHDNNPLSFVVGGGQVLPAFDAGVAMMRVGDKAEIITPSRLAYGASTANGAIPANSVLRFEVEVVEINAYDESRIVKYLADNKITTAQRQPSGLYFLPVVTNPGGRAATAGSKVSVLYTGHLLNAAGTVFDASSQHGNVPINFTVGSGQVIPGFDAGIALMRKGEKAELLMPSSQAYGTRGAPPTISPNALLRFEVELVDVQ